MVKFKARGEVVGGGVLHVQLKEKSKGSSLAVGGVESLDAKVAERQ